MRARISPLVLSRANAFSGGVLLGAGLIHLLGDAVAGFARAYPGLDYPAAYAIATTTFLVVLAIERVVPRGLSSPAHAGGDPEASALVGSMAGAGSTPYVLLATLSIHSIIAGAALGTETDRSAFLVLLAAILAHKASAGFALGTTFERAGASFRQALPALLFFAGSTPVGVLLGAVAGIGFDAGHLQVATAWFKAVAAGTFVYIAVLDVVREEFFPAERDVLGRYVCALLGAGVMATLALWM
jgi:zinc transporter 1/2/3